MREFEFSDAIAILKGTPATFDTLLRTMPDALLRGNEGEGTWNALEIVAHMSFAEHTDWMPRIRTLLEHGETQPFPPFDRFGHLTQDRERRIGELLDEFAILRSDSVRALQQLNLQTEDFSRRGHHPAFGSVTLSQLISTWAVHDFNHLHQLTRVLAQQHREAVGPWSAYLGVLQCNGHSS